LTRIRRKGMRTRPSQTCNEIADAITRERSLECTMNALDFECGPLGYAQAPAIVKEHSRRGQFAGDARRSERQTSVCWAGKLRNKLVSKWQKHYHRPHRKKLEKMGSHGKTFYEIFSVNSMAWWRNLDPLVSVTRQEQSAASGYRPVGPFK
jgi:hypothetical protein